MVVSYALPGLPGLRAVPPPPPPPPPGHTKGASADALTIPRGATIRAADLTAAEIKTYDPGFAHTQACRSAITYLDGTAGVLRYRGYDIDVLAERASFVETTFLLLYGDLPTPAQLGAFDAALVRRATPPAAALAVIAAMPRDGHPMAALGAACAAMSAAHPHLNPSLTSESLYRESGHAREAAALAVLGTFPAIAAAIFRHTAGLAPLGYSGLGDAVAGMGYAARFLYMLNGAPAEDEASAKVLARALDVLLVLHADHELNCSTAALRQLSSSGVDLFTCVGGAAGALYGPLHGGATEGVLKMLVRIGSVDAIPDFLGRVKARRERLMGFGHRVYKNYDPRAKIVRSMAYQVFEAVGTVEPLIQVATALERAALADDYFVERKLYPNIDFYTGLIYKAVGFPSEFFPVLFALGRSSGWVAHWSEFLVDEDRRISRPQQQYVGPARREFVPLEVRRPADPAPSDAALAPPRTIARL
jgi:citrate synthase